jgi:hypothetical protein
MSVHSNTKGKLLYEIYIRWDQLYNTLAMHLRLVTINLPDAIYCVMSQNSCFSHDYEIKQKITLFNLF